MKPAKVEFHTDHMVVKLEGIRRAEAMRSAVVVPYSTIGNADVAPPDWPGLVDNYRVGAFLPGVLARGTFVGWNGKRRFFDIDRGTKQALRIHLEGHAEFDEVEVDLENAGNALDELSRHKAIAPRLPPIYE